MATLELSVRDNWADRFGEIRGELIGAFGATACGYEHIGSTSVPGLLAKPVVDVLVTLGRSTPPQQVLVAMEQLGFDYRGEFGVAQRHFFARDDCHVHGFVRGEGEWTTHLLFRDFLRADADGRATYTRFKLRTARLVGWDRARYQAAKDLFVTEFLPDAEVWADRHGWRPPEVPARVAG